MSALGLRHKTKTHSSSHTNSWSDCIWQCVPSFCCSFNGRTCCGLAVCTPYDGGEVRSDLGFDESLVEGSVWSGDHQGGEQAESEVLKRVGDAAQTPGQTRHQTVTRREEKAA